MRIRWKDLPDNVRRKLVKHTPAKTSKPHGYGYTFASKLELAYADRLELLRHAGTVWGWEYEPCVFSIANRCTYTPDFRVTYTSPGYPIRYVEVKGFWRDDAKVKIKVAARLNQDLCFVVAIRRKKRWIETVVKP